VYRPTEIYLEGKVSHHWPVCCERLLYMVGYLRPSATTSRWTFRHVAVTVRFNMASKLAATVLRPHCKKDFPITQSNVNRLSNFYLQISKETLYEIIKKISNRFYKVMW